MTVFQGSLFFASLAPTLTITLIINQSMSTVLGKFHAQFTILLPQGLFFLCTWEVAMKELSKQNLIENVAKGLLSWLQASKKLLCRSQVFPSRRKTKSP